MGVEDDPGYDNVTDETRAFEQEDEQVFRGAGRGPTPEEDEAADDLLVLLLDSARLVGDVVVAGIVLDTHRSCLSSGAPARHKYPASRPRTKGSSGARRRGDDHRGALVAGDSVPGHGAADPADG